MNKHILVVDDEQEIRDMLSRHFRLLGFEVTTAENGVSALEVLAEQTIRVVISDIMMPEMNGIALLQEIRQEYPMTRVIMITGYVTLDNALACMRNQADTCIFKPLGDLSELVDAVTKAFEHLEGWEQKLVALQGLKTAVCDT